jgi:hypothetical protein
MGLGYGILGLVFIVVLMLYGARKRAYKSRLGTLQGWLHSHIYLGLLALAAIVFHSGFRLHDKVAATAFVLLSIVVLSGIVGAFLYTIGPPMLTDVESNLTPKEMSDQLNELAESMVRLASGKSLALQAVCSSLLAMERPRRMAGWRLLFGMPYRGGDEKETDVSLQKQLRDVGPGEQAELTQLLTLSNEIRELRGRLVLKQRYRNIMEVWLYLHLPFSFALLAVVAAHVIGFFYYW